MDSPLENVTGLRRDLVFLGVSILIVATFAAGHNYATPDEPVRVGLTEVETSCAGIDVGVCLGIQRQDHTTYNYDNWTDPEPGTENFYRLVESELMARAYNVCDEDTQGMEWTDEVSYRNRTASEWLETGKVQLLPCEKTFYRTLDGN